MPARGKKSRSSRKENEEFKDIFDGELKNRKYGVRIDDDLEITMIAGNELLTVKGKLLSMKDDLELVDEKGHYNRIIMDWVVSIKVLQHNRPRPDADIELVKKPLKTKPKKSTVDHAYS